MSAHKHPDLKSTVATSPPAPSAGAIPNNRFPLKAVTALMFVVALLVGLSALFVPRESSAQSAAHLSAGEQANVHRIQKYLNNLSTIEGRFVQVTSKGALARGRLWIERPGRMRFDYDPPVPVLIISDGKTLLFKDEDLEQYSYMRFENSPAAFFIGGNIDFFNGDLAITSLEKGQGNLYLSLIKKKDPREGSMTLVMNDKPMTLRKWMVVDAQGTATTVTLLDAKFGAPISATLFEVEQRWRNERDKNRD